MPSMKRNTGANLFHGQGQYGMPEQIDMEGVRKRVRRMHTPSSPYGYFSARAPGRSDLEAPGIRKNKHGGN